jgi:hypothetical protein
LRDGSRFIAEVYGGEANSFHRKKDAELLFSS